LNRDWSPRFSTLRDKTAGLERFCDFLADPDSRSFSRFGAIIMQFAVGVSRACLDKTRQVFKRRRNGSVSKQKRGAVVRTRCACGGPSYGGGGGAPRHLPLQTHAAAAASTCPHHRLWRKQRNGAFRFKKV
jgi:hypothetical protein